MCLKLFYILISDFRLLTSGSPLSVSSESSVANKPFNQIHLFMRNKPNFRNPKKNLNLLKAKTYENKTLSRCGKNKPNFKPAWILNSRSLLSSASCLLESALLLLCPFALVHFHLLTCSTYRWLSPAALCLLEIGIKSYIDFCYNIFYFSRNFLNLPPEKRAFSTQSYHLSLGKIPRLAPFGITLYHFKQLS
jgi:hypothetical protein